MKLLVDGKPHDGPCAELVRVPKAIAVCPECNGELLVQTDSWETETGVPTEEGIHIDCINEPEPEDEDWHDRRHRFWQSDWQPVIDRVERWAMKHVRVEAAS